MKNPIKSLFGVINPKKNPETKIPVQDKQTPVVTRSKNEIRLDAIPEIILQLDLQLHIVWANKTAIENTDLDPLIGQPAYVAFSYPKGTFLDSYSSWTIYSETTETGIRYMTDFLGHKGGTYWEISCTPLLDHNKTVYGILSIMRDVTARMHREHTGNLLSSIVNLTNDAVYGISISGTVLSWNQGAEMTFGFTADEIIGSSINHILIPEDFSTFYREIEQIMRTGNLARFESKRRRKDGQIIYVTVSFCTFYDATGHKIGISAIERDITQTKHQEQLLMLSEEKYRNLIEQVSDGIARLGEDGRVLFINEVAASLFSLKTEEMIGHSIAEFIPPDYADRYISGLRIILAQRDRRTVEIAAPFLGEKKFFLVATQVVQQSPDKDEFTVMCLITDISEAKQAQEELERSKEQLRSLAEHLENIREQERKDIAFEVHDELGQELTALKLDIAWLETKITDTDPRIKEKIRESKSLLDSTLDRVGSISTKLRPDILDNFGIIAAIEWSTDVFRKRSGIYCELVFDPEEINVSGNIATVIFRILQETLANIIRHSHATHAEVLFSEKADCYELSVIDNGIGISEAQLKSPKSFGLFAMNERAKTVGATLKITGSPDSGTEIDLVIPKHPK